MGKKEAYGINLSSRMPQINCVHDRLGILRSALFKGQHILCDKTIQESN